MMLWWMGLGAALGATPAQEAAQLLEQRTPLLYMGCSPASLLIEKLEAISEQLPAALQDAQQRELRAILSPTGMADAGLDPAGIVSLWVDGDGGHFSFPLSDSPGAQEAALHHLFAQAEQPPPTTPPPWSVGTGEDMGITLAPVRLAGDRPGLRLDLATPGRTAQAMPALVTGMPETAGCLIYMGTPNDPRMEKLQGMSAWVPLEPGAFLLRVRPRDALKLDLQPAGDAPVAASSVREPLVRSLIDMELLALFEQLLLIMPDERGNVEEGLRKLERRVHIPGGTSLALFTLQKDAPEFALVIPLESRRHSPLSARKGRRLMRRVLRGSEGVSWDGPWTFTDDNSKQNLYGGIADGRFVLSSSQETRDEVLAGSGTPWFSSDAQQRAQGWPLYVEGTHPILQGTVLTLGAAFDAQSNTVSLRLEDPSHRVGALLKALSAQYADRISGTLEGLQADPSALLGGGMGDLPGQTPEGEDALFQMPVYCALITANPDFGSAVPRDPEGGLWLAEEGPGREPVLYMQFSDDSGPHLYRMRCLQDEGPQQIEPAPR